VFEQARCFDAVESKPRRPELIVADLVRRGERFRAVVVVDRTAEGVDAKCAKSGPNHRILGADADRDRQLSVRPQGEAQPPRHAQAIGLFETDEQSELEVLPKEGIRIRKRPPAGPTETIVPVKQRRGQEFFRDAVLNNFGGRCGVTGLAIRELLIASHILPWGSHPDQRLNVRNGLSLSRLHDAAFDRGLIAFDDNLRLLLSARLQAELPQRAVAESFAAYAGETLRLSDDAVLPEASFLSRHRSAWGFSAKLAA